MPDTDATPDPIVTATIQRNAPVGFLLARPSYFAVEYEINPYMHLEVQADRAKAITQWETFRDRLAATGAEVIVQEPIAGWPDLVFANNAGFVHGNRGIVSRFRHPEREGEAPHDEATFRALGLEAIVLPDEITAFEGAADAVVFGDKLIVGHGPRSDEKAKHHIADLLGGIEIIDMPLVDERFYHLDLAFLRVSDEIALVSEVATTPEAFAAITSHVPDPIVLDLDDTLAFCANSVVVDRTIFMHVATPRVRAALEQRGYEVVEHDVSEFLKAGGSVGCMSLQLYGH
ncbi:MAG: amidinotransferase [Thermoleophilia bacterium]|nr:amidinotransferase [Thermoleophilia bacterium]